jgi:hypothetical protein
MPGSVRFKCQAHYYDGWVKKDIHVLIVGKNEDDHG